MEISNEELISAEKKKEENESQNLSDGEIVDDEDVKNSIINIPLQKKLQKNFRARHSDHFSESDDDGSTNGKKSGESADKSSKESRKLNSRIENGDEKYLQNVRKKIISELKDDKDRENSKRSDNQKHFNNDRRSFHRDDQFHHRSSNSFERMRPPHTPNSSFSHFPRNNDRNFASRNSFSDRRENGKVKSDMLEVRSLKGSFSLYFPKSCLKYTKTQPSISFAENPRVKQKSNDSRRESTSKQIEKSKDQSKKEKRRSRSKHRSSSSHEKLKESPSKPKHTPKSKNEDDKAEKKELNLSKIEIKLEEEEVKEIIVPFKMESPSYSPITREKSPEKDIIDSSWKLEQHTTPEQVVTEERIKFEPIIIERKKIRKIEKPKVNIFLEDSDEVDEFENSITLEVKSKWSSPVPPPKLYDDFEDVIKPASVPTKQIIEKKIDIPVVIDSPERSPITTGSDSIFDTSVSLSKSSTPQIKNVCSFLTDLESEGYLSSYSEHFDNNISDNEDANEPILLNNKVESATSLFSLNQEPDTTVDKLENKIVDVKDSDSESDSDDESTSTSSSSSSSSSSESSEESSDESTDDETSKIVNIFSGFGRFDATSMPMVTQIKPVISTQTAPTPTESVTTRFQPHQSIIRPPALATNLTKPPLYTPSCISTPNNIPASPIVPSFGQSQFPIPFKIYSLRDAGNNGMIFPQATIQTSMQPPVTPVISEKEKERDKDRERSEKRPEKREREKHRSHSRERDRKKLKEDRRDYDRRKTPPKRRSPSPKRRTPSPKRRTPSPKRRTPSPRRRSISPRRKHVDEKRDTKRRDFSPKHRLSHNSRHSPVRRNRRSPPSRGRTPPPKVRRLSPFSKHRRSSSPSYGRSPSPVYRRNRYSPSSINEQTHLRRTPSRSPEYDRYDRRSYSPSFRKMESPNNGYKPDSTISDTELERQQQFSQMNDYYSWNSTIMPLHSPRRPNLDDRINRMLSDSPTQNSSSLQYPIDSSYYSHHDNPQYQHPNMDHSHQNHQGFYYSDIYPPPQSFIQPPTNMDSRYQAPLMNNHAQSYEDNYNSFSSPRNFVNNSNLVEITQQKREKQRVGSNQIAVQVGNCLEIVPTNEILSPQPVKPPVPKPLSPEEIKQQAERKEQAKIRRKAERERKRMAKYLRKEKLRQEIQKYFDAGINIEDSDDEALVKLRPINVNAVAERGIIKKPKAEDITTAETNDDKDTLKVQEIEKETTEKKEPSAKKVLFKDGVLPGETSSDNELNHENEHEKKVKLKRKRMRKQRLNEMIKERKKKLPTNEMQIIVQKQDQLDTAPPPSPPFGSPPAHLKQPRLKNITPDMFAAFGVNVDPMYYHLHKIQIMKNENNFKFQTRGNYNTDNRYRYQNKHHNNSQYQPNYPQQRYSIPSKPHNSMDPRINQQRTAEKTFA